MRVRVLSRIERNKIQRDVIIYFSLGMLPSSNSSRYQHFWICRYRPGSVSYLYNRITRTRSGPKSHVNKKFFIVIPRYMGIRKQISIVRWHFKIHCLGLLVALKLATRYWPSRFSVRTSWDTTGQAPEYRCRVMAAANNVYISGICEVWIVALNISYNAECGPHIREL
jgi:hypothetical protein